MKNRHARTLSFLLVGPLLASAVTLASSVLDGESKVHAVPQPPHVFFGKVFIGANPATAQPATAGLRIEARIANVNYAQSSQTGMDTRTAPGGTYGQVNDFHVCADTSDTTNRKEGGGDGDVIQFYIDEYPAVARDRDTSVADPVLFQRGATGRNDNAQPLDLFVDLSRPAVAGTPSDEACRIGGEMPTPTPEPMRGPCGDQNGDGMVNVLDVVIDLQIAMGTIEPTPIQLNLSDLNRDGTINVADAVMGLHYIVGSVPTLDECGVAG